MKQTLLLATLLFISARVTFAQNELNLDRCVALAMDHNQNLEQSRATVRSASAGITGAFGTFLPYVSGSFGYRRRLDNNAALKSVSSGGTLYSTTVPYSFSLGATATETLFNGFSNTASYERAHHQYDAADLTYQRNIQDITYQITTDYLNVVRTEQIMISRREIVVADSEQLVQVQAKYDVGTVPKASVLQQETQEANDEVAYLQSANDWNSAKNDLIALMGIDPSVEYTFSHASIPDSIPQDDITNFHRTSGNVQEAIARALKERYDVLAARTNIESANNSITTAQSGYYPSLSASLSWGWSNSQFTDFGADAATNLGINLSIPIFDQFTARTNVESSEASLLTVDATYELLAQQVRSTVKKAYYDLGSAELQLSATNRALQSALENRRTAQERLNLGAGTEIDFITAMSLFITADVNRVNAVYNYLGAKTNVQYLTALMNHK